MKIKNLVCSVVVITAAFLTCAYAEDLGKSVIVTDAWVQAMPPSQTMTAAYMTITNNSFDPIVLESITSEIAGSAEIHQMGEMTGMMKMAMVGKVPIPALGKVILQSGGIHIMLVNLKKPVNKGDIVPMTLHFQGGGAVVVNAVVKIHIYD